MQTKSNRNIRSFLNTVKNIICIFLLLFLSIKCTVKEPDFTVKGDETIIKDVQINVEVIKQNELIMTTAFYKGKSYKIDNEKALRYKIYVSYKNHVFYRFKTDNLHGKIKGESINQIIIGKKQDSVAVLYRPLNESDTDGGKTLQPLDVLFSNIKEKAIEKSKFTTLYKNK